jgi:hypothetical protein
MVTTTKKLGIGSSNDIKPHQSREDVGRKKKWLRCDLAQELCNREVLHRQKNLYS